MKQGGLAWWLFYRAQESGEKSIEILEMENRLRSGGFVSSEIICEYLYPNRMDLVKQRIIASKKFGRLAGDHHLVIIGSI